MELNITKKYAKELLSGKTKKYLKTTKKGTFFTGAIKFEIANTDSVMKKIKVSLWPDGSKEPAFVVKEQFFLDENSVFTFEPITMQIGISRKDNNE